MERGTSPSRDGTLAISKLRNVYTIGRGARNTWFIAKIIFCNLFFNYKTPIKSIISKKGGSSTILLDKRKSLENHHIKQLFNDRNGRNLFWSIKISDEILNNDIWRSRAITLIIIGVFCP